MDPIYTNFFIHMLAFILNTAMTFIGGIMAVMFIGVDLWCIFTGSNRPKPTTYLYPLGAAITGGLSLYCIIQTAY